MGQTQDSISIGKPPASIFAALADPQVQMRYDGEMMRSCEKLTDGAIGKGTRFRGEFKGMGKVEYEYSDFQQDRLIEHSTNMPFGAVHHRFEFAPTEGGTRLTQSITLAPNIVGRIFWPLFIKRMMSKRLRTLNELVKSYVESHST